MKEQLYAYKSTIPEGKCLIEETYRVFYINEEKTEYCFISKKPDEPYELLEELYDYKDVIEFKTKYNAEYKKLLFVIKKIEDLWPINRCNTIQSVINLKEIHHYKTTAQVVKNIKEYLEHTDDEWVMNMSKYLKEGWWRDHMHKILMDRTTYHKQKIKQ